MIDDDRRCRLWRALRESTLLLLPAAIPRLPSLFPRPHLDSDDKKTANQLYYIVHYMYWTLHTMLDAAKKACLPRGTACTRTDVPSACGSHVICVMISIRTLCLASTDLDTIIFAPSRLLQYYHADGAMQHRL
jgi:hypothetical protein